MIDNKRLMKLKSTKTKCSYWNRCWKNLRKKSKKTQTRKQKKS